MAELRRASDLYLQALAGRLVGSSRARKRLLAELRHHLDEAVAVERARGAEAAEAERLAVERLGPAALVAGSWEARCTRVTTRRRGRAALLAGVVALAAGLGVAQHADGRRDPGPPARSCVAQPQAQAAACARAPHGALIP
jgi:hypothetical protein